MLNKALYIKQFVKYVDGRKDPLFYCPTDLALQNDLTAACCRETISLHLLRNDAAHVRFVIPRVELCVLHVWDKKIFGGVK